MERVRSGRTQHVAALPAHTPVQLSKEERQQLRVVKHHAFQRHQQNAMWTRDIFVFDGTTFQVSPVHNPANGNAAWSRQQHPHEGETEEEARLRGQIDANAREIERMKLQIAQVEEKQQKNQERFEELMTGLKTIAESASLASFQERVQQERVHLFSVPVRELEIVKL